MQCTGVRAVRLVPLLLKAEYGPVQERRQISLSRRLEVAVGQWEGGWLLVYWQGNCSVMTLHMQEIHLHLYTPCASELPQLRRAEEGWIIGHILSR